MRKKLFPIHWKRIVVLLSLPLGISLFAHAPQAHAASLPPIKTVFIILMENHNWSSITASAAPYINNTLLPLGAYATQYYNPPNIHPSLPNYLWLEAGTNFGILDDNDPSSDHQNTANHLVTQLNRAGIPWKEYTEDISGTDCPLTDVNTYAVRHDPFVYFDDVTNTLNSNSVYCIQHVRPYTELATALANNMVSGYNFITPNVCDDMHDCSVTTGDTWLSQQIPMIMNSQAYKQGGVIFITWDEAASGDGPIGMIALSPYAKKGYSNAIHYTHSSTLRTVQEIFGVTPLLGDAANATDLSDFFTTTSVTPIPMDTIGIFRPSGRTFYLRLHNSTGIADLTAAFGPGTSPYPIVGDWTGAGFETIGDVDQSNGLFSLCTSNSTTLCANSVNVINMVLGNAHDMPLSGKWNLVGTHFGIGVFRPSNGLIYLKNSLTTGNADYTMVLGIPGDIGLAGDWTGKTYDSPGIYRPTDSSFYLSNAVCNCAVFADIQFMYGIGGDAPVTGDWIGQGHDGVGLFRQSNGYTYLRNTLTTGYADIAFTYGIAGDIPVAGHWQLVYPPAANSGDAGGPPSPLAEPGTPLVSPGLGD